MSKRRDQSHHDSMVQAVVLSAENNGYKNIKADIKGYPPPEPIKLAGTNSGYIPDVTSSGARDRIFEVETSDSIYDEHTAEQWRLFYAYALQYNKQFVVVVPRGDQKKALARAKYLGIELDDILTV